MNIAVITGATGGLGKTFFRVLTQKSKTIDAFWVVARSEPALHQLQKDTTIPVRIFPLDLTKPEALRVLDQALANEKPNVRILVNAAGFGILGPLSRAPVTANAAMVDLNCRALTALSQMVLPYMSAGGQIYNIASVAAFLPQAFFAVYAASKAYVLFFSRALNEELRPHGITVVAVCPNPMDTGFFANAGAKRLKPFRILGYEKPEKVVKNALKQGASRKDLSISSPTGRIIQKIAGVSPNCLVMWIDRYVLK